MFNLLRAILLLTLTFLCQAGLATAHQIASEKAVKLALLSTWTRLPTDQDIATALQQYQARLAKNVSITAPPRKLHLSGETDPLSANKVLMEIRADYTGRPSQLMAVTLRQDLLSNSFRFEGVLMQGIKRYPGDKSTASFLEPQDLVYLKKGWLPSPLTDVNDAAVAVVLSYMQQFDNSCFGQVIHMGDPDKYRKALTQQLIIDIAGAAFTKKRQAAGSHEAHSDDGEPNIIHLPFDPRDPKLQLSQQKTLYHEATHQIEWLYGVQAEPLFKDFVGFKERTEAYLDRVPAVLSAWRRAEYYLLKGDYTVAEVADHYRTLQQGLRKLERGFGTSEDPKSEGQWWRPDLRRLEVWAGIRMRFEDIQRLYLSGACGEALRKVAEIHARAFPDPSAIPGIESIPDNTAGRPAQPPTTQTPSRPTPAPQSGTHIVYAMVYDQASSKPVSGAAFSVLRPGVTTAQWVAAGFDPGMVVSQGISDASGMVALNPSLARGHTFSFMVAREGYKVIRYEALKITADSPEPLKITVRLRH